MTHSEKKFDKERRKFVTLVIAGLVTAGPVSVLIYRALKDTTFGVDYLEEFKKRFPDVCKISEEYLRLHPEEASFEVLCTLLFGFVPKSYESTLTKESVAALAGKMSKDFSEKNTLMISGWMLSRTELRVFALRAVIDKGCTGS